jgi:siderophore synthetase component
MLQVNFSIKFNTIRTNISKINEIASKSEKWMNDLKERYFWKNKSLFKISRIKIWENHYDSQSQSYKYVQLLGEKWTC